MARFLAGSGWRLEQAKPLAGDASFRRYLRLANGTRRAVLMDAPPTHEDVRPYARLARHLRGLGLSAPEVFAEDDDAGFLLLEDFGDDTYTRVLAAGTAEEPLYALATDALIHIHRLDARKAVPVGLPAYDEDRLLGEALLLTDWFMPAVVERPTPDSVREAYIAAWRQPFALVQRGPQTLVLRDYHVDNLMRLSGRQGVAACGLLDFQDALVGSPAYDLMSLLEDARRDVSSEVKAAMLERYHQALPECDRETFATAFAVLAAQRHAKVIGIFTRLCRRDGKPAYLVHIPRVWRLLEQALCHPVLAPVARWFDRHLPAETRRIPPCPAP